MWGDSLDILICLKDSFDCGSCDFDSYLEAGVELDCVDGSLCHMGYTCRQNF